MGRGAPKDLADGTITLMDGTTPTPNSVVFAIEEGNLSFQVQQPKYNILDRGSLSHQRLADEVPVTGSVSIYYVQALKQSGDTTPEVYEAVQFIGAAASWVSTNDDNGDVKNLDMKYEIVNPDSTLESERITFQKTHFSNISVEEGRPNKISFDFEAFVTKPDIAKYTP